jgi:hypothetical protein
VAHLRPEPAPLTPAARTIAGLLAILVLALVLRLPRGELAEWKGDEAVTFNKAYAIARLGDRPTIGLHTTDGPRIPVHFLYVIAAPLVFWDSPEAIRVLVALLTSGAVALVFLFGRAELGERGAFAGALLLATLPDLVRRGRWSWSPNLVLPLAAVFLLLLLRAVRRPRGRTPGLLLFFATALVLIHYSTIGAACLGALVAFASLFRGASWRGLALGAAASLILALPQIAYEATHGGEIGKGALAVARKDGANPERAPLAYWDQVADALALDAYARAAGSDAAGPFARPASALLLGLVAFGAGAGARDLARAARAKMAPKAPGVLLLVALASWSPFLLLHLPARPHYVPLATSALLLGAGCVLGDGRGRPLRALAALGLFFLAASACLATRSALVSVATHPVAGSSYDLPFEKKHDAVRRLLEDELEFAGSRHFEYQPLLEWSYRELAKSDKKKAERFELVLEPVPYWDIVVALPHPRAPRGRVALVETGDGVAIVETR